MTSAQSSRPPNRQTVTRSNSVLMGGRGRGPLSLVVTLSVIRVRILSIFLHFRSPSIAGFMLTATRPVERNPIMTDTAQAMSTSDTAFDPTVALGDLLADVGLSVADAGGRVTFAGQDPIIAARHRLGAAIGIPMMGNAIAAAAMHRNRGGPGQRQTFSSRCSCTTYPTSTRCFVDCQPTTPAWRCSIPVWCCARSNPGDGCWGSTAAHSTWSPSTCGRRWPRATGAIQISDRTMRRKLPILDTSELESGV
ncbi:MAG: hypothetical protein QOH34_2137 [Mycobacterium sp.]|nr:hypothetical protein [Mycobacterium sp.]